MLSAFVPFFLLPYFDFAWCFTIALARLHQLPEVIDSPRHRPVISNAVLLFLFLFLPLSPIHFHIYLSPVLFVRCPSATSPLGEPASLCLFCPGPHTTLLSSTSCLKQ